MCASTVEVSLLGTCCLPQGAGRQRENALSWDALPLGTRFFSESRYTEAPSAMASCSPGASLVILPAGSARPCNAAVNCSRGDGHDCCTRTLRSHSILNAGMLRTCGHVVRL